MSGYFAARGANDALAAALEGAGISPWEELAATLDHAGLEVRLGEEPGRGCLAPFIAQQLTDAVLGLHHDFAPLDALGWSIGQVSAQLAWNIYIAVPEVGGELEVFDRRWHEEDESKYRRPGSYAYLEQLVEGLSCRRVPPRVGDMVLFDSRRYHRVRRGRGRRISLGGFLGRRENGIIVGWA